jgi:hypothetical protein
MLKLGATGIEEESTARRSAARAVFPEEPNMSPGEANSCSAGQRKPSVSWNPKIHYQSHEYAIELWLEPDESSARTPSHCTRIFV